MVTLDDSNLVPRFPSRAHPRVQGSIFATKHQTVHQGPSLTRSARYSQVLQGKSTSSPRRLHRVDHSNQQYSILALTDSSGAVVERVAYQAYGQPTFMNAAGTTLSSSAKAGRYSFTGREWDPSLELHHFRARWMSGVGGHFLSKDPIDYHAGDLNLYRYVASRPQIAVDPSGLSAYRSDVTCYEEWMVNNAICLRNFRDCLALDSSLEPWYEDMDGSERMPCVWKFQFCLMANYIRAKNCFFDEGIRFCIRLEPRPLPEIPNPVGGPVFPFPITQPRTPWWNRLPFRWFPVRAIRGLPVIIPDLLAPPGIDRRKGTPIVG